MTAAVDCRETVKPAISSGLSAEAGTEARHKVVVDTTAKGAGGARCGILVSADARSWEAGRVGATVTMEAACWPLVVAVHRDCCDWLSIGALLYKGAEGCCRKVVRCCSGTEMISKSASVFDVRCR